MSTTYAAVNMSGIPLLALTSAISGVPRHASLCSDHVLVGYPACHILKSQCGHHQEHVSAAQTHILHEKAAQRRLRAEIAAFLRERGTIRSASECLLVSTLTGIFIL